MNILITGGSGFIGSHCILELWENSHQIYVIDNYSTSSADIKEKISKLTNDEVGFFDGDIRDSDLIFDILKSKKIELVIHLAGYKSIQDSFVNPELYHEINVHGTKSLVNSMQKSHVKNLIFSSSATVYGKPKKLPISEDSILDPIHPYGLNKVKVENFLKDIASSDPMWNIINFRYFNPIGAHHSLEIGENMHSVPNNLVPFILKVLLKEERFLKVFGKDYPTDDGTCIRDYIHISDIAIAHCKGIKSLYKLGSGFHCINLGSGKGYSVLEIINEFEKVTKTKIPFQYHERRDGDVASLCANISLAKRSIGWEPNYTLQEMCASAYQFALKTCK